MLCRGGQVGMARFLLVFGWCLYYALVTFDSTAAAPIEPTTSASLMPKDEDGALQPLQPNDQMVSDQPGPGPDGENQKLVKRSAAPESNHDDYPDYLLGVKYDEYPMIVPKKRAALLIDRLMVALQKAIEDEEGRGMSARTKNYSLRSEDVMDLQRRGHQSVSGQKNGRYWRCYFNAVTCF